MDRITPKAVAPDEAAKIVGLGRSVFWRYMKEGRIPFRRVGRRRIVLIADLDSYLESLPRAA